MLMLILEIKTYPCSLIIIGSLKIISLNIFIFIVSNK